MIKQIKRGVAISILIGTCILNIGAIVDKSDKMTTQNSTLNEQQTDVFFEFNKNKENVFLDLKPIDTEKLKLSISSETEQKKVKKKTSKKKKQNNQIILSEKDWEILYRVARCEAGGWCITNSECGKCSECFRAKQGQKNIVYVVLNRLHNEKFPNSVTEIVFAPRQFSVVNSSIFYNIELTDNLKSNVKEAVNDWNKDSANGALYFNSIDKNYWNWVDFLFEDEVGHYFYK